MSFLFGSAPSVKTTTNPTINPLQEGILGQVAQFLQSGAPAPGSAPYPGTFSAPPSDLQSTSLAALEQTALQAAQVPQFNTQPAQDLVQQIIGGRYNVQPTGIDPLLISGAQPIRPTSVSAPLIDSTQAFQQGVVDPTTQDFLERTLPTISGKYGLTAGGAFGSEQASARGKAELDTTRALAQAGTQFAYDASKANQAATLSALQGNQATDLSAQATTGQQALTGQIANQSAVDAARTANAVNTQSAATTNLAAMLQVPGIAASAAGLPFAGINASISPLLQTLGAGAVPYNIAQTQVAGQYQDYLNQQNFTQQRLADAIAAALGTTQQTTSVASGGSSGLLSGLLPAAGQFAGSSAGSSLIASLFASDERLKEDMEEVGDVDGIPLYRYRYKGEPSNVVRVGFKAQDVARRMPSAVHTDRRTGLKAVDYGEVLSSLLKEAA